MEAVPWEIVSAGVDWVTLTLKEGKSTVPFLERASSLLHKESARGNMIKPWGFSGYTGLRCAEIHFGQRYDGACLRLSGKLAHEHWREFYDFGSRPSRIDIEVTTRNEKKPNQTIQTAYRGALREFRRHKHGPRVTKICDTTGGFTLYLGCRQSDQYGRCYNKEVEAGLTEWAGCVRWEIEFKGNRARQIASELNAVARDAPWCVAQVSQFMANHGCNLELHHPPADNYSCPHKPADDRRRLTWLRDQVSSTVEWLCQRGLTDEVVLALKLSDRVVVLNNDMSELGPTTTEGVQDVSSPRYN